MSKTALGLVVVLLAACGSPEPPVAGVAIDRDVLELSYPGYVPLVLEWRIEPAAGESTQGTTVFVHLLDEEGELVRTFDHPFPGPWRAGVVVEDPVDLYQSALGPPLPAGRYLLTVGLTDSEGRRLPLEVPGPDLGRHEYELALVRVGAARPVSFSFEGGWEEPEAGADRQILGRRWLGGEGRLRVGGALPGDRVLLWLSIPDPARYGGRFEMEDEASVPEVEVSTPCGEETVVVSGQGQHRLEPRLGEPERDDCELELRANFVFQDPSREGPARSAVLEVLSHRPE